MIKAYKLNFKFEKPVRIAWKTFHNNAGDLLLVKRNNFIGYGEAVPDPFITKDTQKLVFHYLKENAFLLPKEINLDTIKETHKRLPIGSPTARAAIDFALHDLWGKQEKSKISCLYSKNVNTPLNCITLFGKNLKETQVDAEKILNTYPHLKVIKIKLMGKNDIKRCEAIKEKADEMKRKISYVLDCNQAYKTSVEAIKILNQLGDILQDIILIEEPTPAKQWNLMKEVTDNVGIPIFADESAVNFEDVKTIIKKQCADGINIKLQKTGGIWPAKIIAEECEKHELKVMVGCMFESAIGIAAGVHFAQSTKNVILTDLDYDLQMPDIYKYKPAFTDGTRKSADKAGLGVELDFNKIEDLKKSSKLIFERII
ncbi:MAG: enolase C-terminal domain-like protein [Nanoarchaeota archaeon]